jgi:integrase
MSVANPFRLPVAQPGPRDAVALTPDEVRKALAQPKLDPSRRAMLGLYLLAGPHLGEHMAITSGQIRLKDDLIVVDRAVRVEFGGKQTVGLPKGGKTRNAVMCRTLKDLLPPHAHQHHREVDAGRVGDDSQRARGPRGYRCHRSQLHAPYLPGAEDPSR